MSDRYSAKISHEIPAGPSGPARSYWDIYFTPEGSRHQTKVGTVQQPPTKGAQDWGHLDIPGLCWMLEAAYKRGQEDMQLAVQRVIGIKR